MVKVTSFSEQIWIQKEYWEQWTGVDTDDPWYSQPSDRGWL